MRTYCDLRRCGSYFYQKNLNWPLRSDITSLQSLLRFHFEIPLESFEHQIACKPPKFTYANNNLIRIFSKQMNPNSHDIEEERIVSKILIIKDWLQSWIVCCFVRKLMRIEWWVLHDCEYQIEFGLIDLVLIKKVCLDERGMREWCWKTWVDWSIDLVTDERIFNNKLFKTTL